MTQWILYLDESGCFEEASNTSFVGGALLDVSAVGVDAGTLKRAFVACYPYFPWPLHATDTRRPMAHVAGAMLLGVPAERLEEPLGRARRLVQDATIGPLQEIREAVARGAMPTQDLLERSLEELASKEPVLSRLLREYPQSRMRVSVDLFAALARVLDKRIYAIGAGVGAGVAYPEALTHCIYRALQCIRQRSEPEVALRLTVASRGKPDGTGTTVEELLQLASEAARMAELPGEPPKRDVDVSADIPKVMDSATSPWLVLADFVCNRLISSVRNARNWRWLAAQTTTCLKLPVSIQVGWLSAILPSLTFRRGHSGVDPGWGADQARIWAEAARRSS